MCLCVFACMAKSELQEMLWIAGPYYIRVDMGFDIGIILRLV